MSEFNHRNPTQKEIRRSSRAFEAFSSTNAQEGLRAFPVSLQDSLANAAANKGKRATVGGPAELLRVGNFLGGIGYRISGTEFSNGEISFMVKRKKLNRVERVIQTAEKIIHSGVRIPVLN